MSGESRKGWLLTAARILLAVLFLWAGGSKVGEPAELAQVIERYALLPAPWLAPLALILPLLEIVLGVCLLLGFWVREAALLALGVTAAFSLAVGSALARGLNIECGCFSGASKVSYIHLALDLVMLLSSLALTKAGPGFGSLDARLEQRSPRGASRTLVISAIGLTLLNSLALGLAIRESKAVSSPSIPPPAGLVFEKTILNLGQVQQGESVRTTVAYRNDGPDEIELVRLKASCGCTLGDLSKEVLRSGESGTLEITFHAGAKRGPSSETLQVFLRGTSQPVVLNVLAQVQPVVVFEPALISPKVGQTVRVRMKALKPGLKFQVREIRCPVPGLKVSLQEYDRAGSAWLLAECQQPMPAPPAPSNAWPVRVQTDIPDMPPFHLYVKAGDER